MAVLTLDGCDLYCEDRGEGTPLLLLHGGMGIGSDWRLVFPTDPPGYRVIVPDLRGHGRSTNPSGHFTFRQCALDVLALLDRLGVTRTHAIGLSMGAKALLHLATIAPARIESMVLVSATPVFPPTLRAAARQFSSESFDRLPDNEKHALRRRHLHGDDQIRALYEMTRRFADSHDDMCFTQATLGTITARTLIVHGDRDPLYPIELAIALYRGIPRAALWTIPHGVHSPIFGAAAPRFAEIALAYLAGHLESATP